MSADCETSLGRLQHRSVLIQLRKYLGVGCSSSINYLTVKRIARNGLKDGCNTSALVGAERFGNEQLFERLFL